MCLTTTETEYVKLTSNAAVDTATKVVEPVKSRPAKDVQQGEVLTTAPPPWHSVALIGFLFALFANIMPSWDELDQVAALSTFSRTEAWISSVWYLGLVRSAIAATIWGTTLHVLCGPGWTAVSKWKKGSKLKQRVSIEMKGIKTMFPFTSCSWNMLGLSYALNAFIAVSVATGNEEWIANAPHNWVLRLALISWEIAAPCALLVSTVVRYAIWEMDLKSTGDTVGLRSFRNLMMHNANSFYVLVEVALLGGLPVRFSEVSLAPLFGITYVIFSWSMSRPGLWTDAKHGPQFIYFFFDTTLGKFSSVALLVLLCALLLFYVLFAYARGALSQLSDIIVALGGAQEVASYSELVLVGHVGFVALLCGAVCRFRD